MQELKVGDKVIMSHVSEWTGRSLKCLKVKKINKATYTLENDVLLKKENLKPHRQYVSGEYEIFTEARWNELVKEFEEYAYQTWKYEIERRSLKNIDHMKRYIEEQEAKEAIK